MMVSRAALDKSSRNTLFAASGNFPPLPAFRRGRGYDIRHRPLWVFAWIVYLWGVYQFSYSVLFPGKWSTCPLPEKGIKKKLFLCLLLLTSTSIETEARENRNSIVLGIEKMITEDIDLKQLGIRGGRTKADILDQLSSIYA